MPEGIMGVPRWTLGRGITGASVRRQRCISIRQGAYMGVDGVRHDRRTVATRRLEVSTFQLASLDLHVFCLSSQVQLCAR